MIGQAPDIQITAKWPCEDRRIERKPYDREGRDQRDAAGSQGRSKVIRKLLIKRKTSKGSSYRVQRKPGPANTLISHFYSWETISPLIVQLWETESWTTHGNIPGNRRRYFKFLSLPVISNAVIVKGICPFVSLSSVPPNKSPGGLGWCGEEQVLRSLFAIAML